MRKLIAVAAIAAMLVGCAPVPTVATASLKMLESER